MQRTPREVSVPAEAFDRLRSVLVDEAGENAGVHALHSAGFSTGRAFFELFSRAHAGSPSECGTDEFWARLTTFFASRGWGHLEHTSVHPGVSVLASDDWAEAETGEGAQPSCAFTSGVLAYLLTRTAGAPVAVLETGCRSRGDPRCEFAFGSEQTIHDLYAVLLEGRPLADALAHL